MKSQYPPLDEIIARLRSTPLINVVVFHGRLDTYLALLCADGVTIAEVPKDYMQPLYEHGLFTEQVARSLAAHGIIYPARPTG